MAERKIERSAAPVLGAGFEKRGKLDLMLRGLVIAGAVAAIATGACSSSSTTNAPNSGKLAGQLQLASTTAGGSPPQGVSGVIMMQEKAGTTRTATAGSDGAFSATVPARSYTVTGRSPMFILNGSQGLCVAESGSGPAPVEVRAGETTSITIVCPTK
jgi:hypothetical protein